eukprot:1397951-Pleurochrysis_carterae.AAC.3
MASRPLAVPRFEVSNYNGFKLRTGNADILTLNTHEMLLLTECSLLIVYDNYITLPSGTQLRTSTYDNSSWRVLCAVSVARILRIWSIQIQRLLSAQPTLTVKL